MIAMDNGACSTVTSFVDSWVPDDTFRSRRTSINSIRALRLCYKVHGPWGRCSLDLWGYVQLIFGLTVLLSILLEVWDMAETFLRYLRLNIGGIGWWLGIYGPGAAGYG
jgi:hypothetical protein